MAIRFTAASTQYLTNTAPPLLDYPITIGLWFKLTAVGASRRTLFCISDTATTTNFFDVSMDTNETILLGTNNGGAENQLAVTSTIIAGAWNFLLVRLVAAADRRVTHVNLAGTVVTSATTSNSRAMSGLDTSTIGAKLTTSAGQYWDGDIAEFWIAKADIYANGLQLTNAAAMRLALGGPFEWPRLAANIVEYRSFRDGIASETDSGSNVYHGGARQKWAAVNGPIRLSAHPPLPYWYVRPGQVKTPLVI